MRRWFLALASLVSLTPFLLSTGARADFTDHYGLLLVWMPGLCKLEPERAECKDLTLRRYDGLNLAFMALQSLQTGNGTNTYCFTMLGAEDRDRSRDWCDMYQPRILDSLAEQLKTLMPITQSCQDRAMWARYASCTLYSGDEYYKRAVKLAKAIAGTQMNSKIAGAVGESVKLSDLVEAFKADFGEDNSNAVDFICRKIAGRAHLLQVRITLTPRALTRGLERELLWKPTQPLRRSCPENILVDAPPVPTVGASPAPTQAEPTQGEPTQAEPTQAPPPGEPAAPQSVPIGPVDIEPLEPPGPVVR